MRILTFTLLLLVSASGAWGQVKDYVAFEWGESWESVVDYLQMTGQSVESIGEDYVTVHSVTGNGQPMWETYLFTDGLGVVFREVVTEWRTSDQIPLIHDYYLPRYMMAIAMLSDGPFPNTASGDNYRQWAGEDSIAASYYLPDHRGVYRVHSFAARLSPTEIATALMYALEMGIFLDFEPLIDPEWDKTE